MFLEQLIVDCFFILKFQIIFLIEEFKEGFGKSNDMANNLNFIF